MSDRSEETPEPDKGSEDPVTRRTLFRHPLAAVGGAMVGAGVVSFVVLVLIDLTGAENPYRSLVTFIAVPAVITLGAILFLIAVRIQVVQARRRGEKVRFNLRIEPSDPRYMRSLWIFLGLGVLLLVLVAWSGVRAYEATGLVLGEVEDRWDPPGLEDHDRQLRSSDRNPDREPAAGSGDL